MREIQSDESLHTFKLKTQGFTLGERLDILRYAYHTVLKEDPHWHFFFEAEFGEFVRVSEEHVPLFAEYLTENEIEFEHEPFWYEEHDFIKVNLEYFKKLYHLNSEFAMTYEGPADSLFSYLNNFVERYSHSLHDMIHLVLGGDVLERESKNLALVVLNRSFYDGYRAYYLRNR